MNIHNILNRKITFKLDALLKRQGIYIVGGAVRDRLLGRDAYDIDIAVQGNPLKLAERIANRMHCRIIPLGPRSHPLFRLVTPSYTIDISALQGNNLETDLLQRDFTINALAYETGTHHLIDVTRGVNDISKRQIRLVSQTGFQADPLRLLRAYRLASQLDFQIEDNTLRALHQEAALIRKPAVERIQAELRAILSRSQILDWLQRMADSKILFYILPELKDLVGCRQGRQHALDVFDHTLQTVHALQELTTGISNTKPEFTPLLEPMNTPRRIRLHLAALLHDIGKPITRQKSTNDQIRFYGHDTAGAQIAAAIGKRLRMPRKEVESIVQLVRHHLRPYHLFEAFKHNQLGSKGMTRFFMQTKGSTADLLILALADMRAKAIKHRKALQDFEDFIAQLAKRYTADFKSRSDAPPLLNGFDLIYTLQLTPSPLFNKILQQVRQAQLSGQITTPKEAMALAAEMVSQ